MDYFRSRGMSDEEAEKEVSTYDIWYSIIDGTHSNDAIRQLRKTKLNWKIFQRFATLLKGCQPLKCYGQLSRAQNTRYSARCIIELTLFDNLRLENEQMICAKTKAAQV